MKGRIAIQAGPRQIEFVEHEVPAAKSGCVLVKVRLANICGSDMHNFMGGGLFSHAAIGHEYVGEIAELGEGVTQDYAGNQVKVGDRIVAPYYMTCGKCDMCVEGHFDQCRNAYTYLSLKPDQWPYFTGAFSDFTYIHEHQYFYKVPDSIPDELVAGANCAFSQSYAAVDQLGVTLGDTFLVQGAGGLGLYAVCIAKERGARVMVVDGVQDRLEMAKRFGADEIIDMNKYKTVKERVNRCLELTDGKGVTHALEVCGFAPAFEEGLQYMRNKGKYMLVGINVIGRECTMSPGYITRKALVVMGCARYNPKYLHDVLLFIEKHKDKYPMNEMSDEIYPMEDLQKVLEAVCDRKIVRAIVKP